MEEEYKPEAGGDIMTCTAEYNKEWANCNIPQTLAGMLTVTSADAVVYISQYGRLHKICSFGLAIGGNKAYVLFYVHLT